MVAEEYAHRSTRSREVYSTCSCRRWPQRSARNRTGALDTRHQRFIFDSHARDGRGNGRGHNGQGRQGETTSCSWRRGARRKPPSSVTGPTPWSKHPVFCLPAADEADEIAAVMLAQILEGEGYTRPSRFRTRPWPTRWSRRSPKLARPWSASRRRRPTTRCTPNTCASCCVPGCRPAHHRGVVGRREGRGKAQRGGATSLRWTGWLRRLTTRWNRSARLRCWSWKPRRPRCEGCAGGVGFPAG